MDLFSHMDSQLLLFFNSIHTAYFDRFWMLFTGRFIWVPMYAAMLYVVIRDCGWRRALTIIFFITLAIAVTDQFCGNILRHTIERMRPSNPANPLSDLVQTVGGYRGGRFGFPSCHAANSFALATFYGFLMRRRRVVVFLVAWAVCNSYSRLYLGVHYPGDILVGSVFGFIFGGLSYLALESLANGTIRTSSRGILRLRHSDIVIIVGLLTIVAIAIISMAM